MAHVLLSKYKVYVVIWMVTSCSDVVGY